MNIIDKVGQMLMVGFHGLEAPDYILEWLKEGKVGGVILFARNVESPKQVADLCQSLHDVAKYPILISIDQEGGAVARLREGFSQSPGAMALSATNDEQLTEDVSRILGQEMKTLGINWTYAPAVDISYNKENPTVGVRSFGSDKESVSQFASAAVRGFQSGGVAACAKHFPTLGDTAIDTHLALATVTASVEQVVLNDLLPYRVAMDDDLASIMTTHTVFVALDEDYPATLSPIVIKSLLREDLGFNGVVTTDCMEMKAIADNYGTGESAVLAMLAGVDIVLFSHTRSMQEEAYSAMIDAVESGRVPLDMVEKANERIAKLKSTFPADVSDIASIREEESLDLMRSAAQKSLIMPKNEGVIPLNTNAKIGLIEYASYLDSNAVEFAGLTGLSTALKQAIPSVETAIIRLSKDDDESKAKAQSLAESCDIVIVATRNAHLWEHIQCSAEAYLDSASKSVLLALRNPYDAEVLKADAVICSFGDAEPSLEAVVSVLVGEFVPSGKLPVSLEINS